MVLAIANPFTLNAPTKVSANWFGESERVVSTTVGAYANVFGIAFGYFFPSLWVSDMDLTDSTQAKMDIYRLSFYLTIISSVAFILVLLTFRSKPPTPSAFTNMSDHDDSMESSSML